MTWLVRLTVWWMNFATLLASWMLRFGTPASAAISPQLIVRMLSKNGSIVRTSPGGTLSQWPPLVHRLTSTEKLSTTWFLLASINETLDSRGLNGVANGEEMQMWFTLSFQEPQRGPYDAGKPGPRS